jgi:formylglycine-generating enzyme required for sulfatase activity
MLLVSTQAGTGGGDDGQGMTADRLGRTPSQGLVQIMKTETRVSCVLIWIGALSLLRVAPAPAEAAPLQPVIVEPHNQPPLLSTVRSNLPPPQICFFDATNAKVHQAAWARYYGLPVEKEIVLPGGAKMTLVFIPPGEFLMGSTRQEQAKFRELIGKERDDGMDAERPQHRVRITQAFYLGKYEVTQAQWQSVMGSKTPAEKSKSFGKTDNQAAAEENVSWEDTHQFLHMVNRDLAGGTVALPTEAQWEYACRAGTTTAFYCGDDKETVLENGWFKDAKNKKGSRYTAQSVGQLKPNLFGLYDVAGNVNELCADWFDEGFYKRSPLDDPHGPASGSARVIRGGAMSGSWWSGRSASRYGRNPEHGDAADGFRVAFHPATLRSVIAPPPR